MMARNAGVTLLGSMAVVVAVFMNGGRSIPRETIHWKFNPGEKLHYQLQTVETRNLDYGGEKSTEVLRRTFWFRWEVESVDGYGNARIHVTFNRIQAESETPAGKIAVDTDAPLGKRECERAPAAKELQDDAFRMVRSSFVFRASPHGGVPRPLPDVPTAIYMPERFTTGHMLAFVEQPMGVGGEWALDAADAEPRLVRPGKTVHGAGIGAEGAIEPAYGELRVMRRGKTNYRVMGSVVLKGVPCWKIRSDTTYEPSNDVPRVTVLSEPATGTHYFDNAKGRLVYSEQTSRYRTKSEQSGKMLKVDVDLSLTYTLLPSAPEPSRLTVSRELADGETVEFQYENGVPVYADGEWAKVNLCNGNLELQRKHHVEGVPHQQFIFVLRLKTENIKSISIYDVTAPPVVRVARARELPAGQLEPELRTEPLYLTDPGLDWLRTDEVTEWIFKIVLENDRGQKQVLYQPLDFPTGAVRDHLIEKRLVNLKNFP